MIRSFAGPRSAVVASLSVVVLCLVGLLLVASLPSCANRQSACVVTDDAPQGATDVRRWTQWENSWWETFDVGVDRRMVASVELANFLRFAASNDLVCEEDKPRRHTCIRVLVDCSHSGRGREDLPEILLPDFSVPRTDTTMTGCWEFSVAQWSKGRMVAVDYVFYPYY